MAPKVFVRRADAVELWGPSIGVRAAEYKYYFYICLRVTGSLILLFALLLIIGIRGHMPALRAFAYVVWILGFANTFVSGQMLKRQKAERRKFDANRFSRL